MPATFMTVGFSASSALITWRLSQSSLFQVYTYWPANEVTFSTQTFGNTTSTFLPNQLDLQNLPPGTPPMNIVLLVINSIKDVSRMCKKIQPVIDKRTLILVDVSAGTGPLQRVVRPHLSKNQVAGIVCDFNVRVIAQEQPRFEIAQYGDAKSTGPKPACIIEPVAPKVTASLVTALQSVGMNCQQPKTVALFGAHQWERSIAIVAFELLGLVLGRPTVEELISDVVAKPIIDGLITELTSVAQATGVKGLPSKHQFIKSSSALVRRAPPGFRLNRASWLFAEYYEKQPVSLDFLLLLPILLADELSKSGPTPYLESLYAFSSHLVTLNDHPSPLLARNLDDVQAKAMADDSIVQRTKDLDAAELGLVQARREAKESELRNIQREEQCELREQSLMARLEKLEQQEVVMAQRSAEIERQQEQAISRAVAQAVAQAVTKTRQEMAAQMEQQVQIRTAEALARAREETSASRASSRTSSSGSNGDSDREQTLEQRERALDRRERALVQRELQLQAARPPSNLGSPVPNMPANVRPRHNGSMPNLQSATATPRTQSQQWGPANGLASPPYTNGPPLPNGPVPNGPVPNGPSSAANGVPGAGMAPPHLPRSRRPSVDQPGARPGMSPPTRSGTNLAGMFNDYSLEGASRPRRPMSRAQSISSVSNFEANGSAANRNHRPSIPNSATFSQQFQLDGIMSMANDRYGMVSRKNRGSTAGLSSDQQQVPRPFVHGSQVHGRSGSKAHLHQQPLPQQHPRQSHDSGNDYGSGGSGGSAGSSGSVNSVKPARRSPEASPVTYEVYGSYDPNEQAWNSASANSQSSLPRSRTGTPPTPQMGVEGSHLSLNLPKLAPIEKLSLEFAL